MAKRGGAKRFAASSKAQLVVKRAFAIQQNDEALLADVEAQLAKLESNSSSSSPSKQLSSNQNSPTKPNVEAASEPAVETEQDRMRRLNERNRASNREDIKRAEGKAQDERRRMARKLQRGDSDVVVDPSARVKTMTRLHHDRLVMTKSLSQVSYDLTRQCSFFRANDGLSGSSKPGTPANGTPRQRSPVMVEDVPVSSKATGTKFEELLASRVKIDVDLDF